MHELAAPETPSTGNPHRAGELAKPKTLRTAHCNEAYLDPLSRVAAVGRWRGATCVPPRCRARDGRTDTAD